MHIDDGYVNYLFVVVIFHFNNDINVHRINDLSCRVNMLLVVMIVYSFVGIIVCGFGSFTLYMSVKYIVFNDQILLIYYYY